MTLLPDLHRIAARAGRVPVRSVRSWGRIAGFTAALAVGAVSPRSWRPAARQELARHMVLDTLPILGGFSTVAALFTLIIARIVIATADSYGLSQYALEMLVRVLVIELIPLTAALFVALRCTIPGGAELARQGVGLQGAGSALGGRLLAAALPRMLSGMFACITLAALSCVVAMVLVYLSIHGFSLAGLPGYTHVVGQVFTPAFALIFVLKTLLFALTVSIIPMASGLDDAHEAAAAESALLVGLVRMFGVLLALEALSLVGNYV